MDSTKGNEPKLARHWGISRVQRCLDSADKDSLVAFVDQRYRERFFEPVEKLMESPGQLQGYGFAIMALCSLLIESLQCYRYGLPTTYEAEYKKSLNAFNPPANYRISPTERKSGREAFQDFFSLDIHKELFPGVDGVVFYNAIRNGLLHQAQTKQGWRIRGDQPRAWNSTDKIVDRTRFANALKSAFEKYVEELRAAAWDDDLWLKARRKIWWLIQLSS
jgi:hypothetical protein